MQRYYVHKPTLQRQEPHWDRLLHLIVIASISIFQCNLNCCCTPEEPLAKDDCDLRRKMYDIHHQVRNNIEKSNDIMKNDYDFNAQEGFPIR